MTKTMLLSCAIATAMWQSASWAAIIRPTYLIAASAPNSFSTSTPAKTVDNSALSSSVDTGATLAAAQAVTHSFNNAFGESYVSNANGSDYFAAGTPPTIVYDLGGDVTIGDVVLWQYQNNGTNGTSIGNHVKSIDFRINTDAQGTGSFAGPVTTLDNIQNVAQLGGTNSAQTFALSGMGRYVQLTLSDNHFGTSGVTGGGDRVGLGEVRFNEIPEPGALALCGLGLACMIGISRRRRGN